jgi:hypothetical protein
MEWTDVARDTDRWRVLVNAAMNLRFLYNTSNFLTTWRPVSVTEGHALVDTSFFSYILQGSAFLQRRQTDRQTMHAWRSKCHKENYDKIWLRFDIHYKTSHSFDPHKHRSIRKLQWLDEKQGPNILLGTLSLRSSLNVSDQYSYPYKTTDKIIDPCILIFTFFDSKLHNKRFCTEWLQAFPDFNLLLIFFLERTFDSLGF